MVVYAVTTFGLRYLPGAHIDQLEGWSAGGMAAGLGAGRLHEGDSADPVVGVLELAGVSKSGLEE